MLVDKVIRKYPVRVGPADFRDYIYARTHIPLRESVDLRKWASAVENQGHLGSCIGNATVGAYELLLNQLDPAKFQDLSRLFVYYNARLLEGTVDEDVGAFVRDGIKSLTVYGVCAESIWPYNIKNYAISPSDTSYQDAKSRNIKNYFRINGLQDMLDALNNNKPIVIGLSVYSGFEAMDFNTTYILPMPAADESPLGGHAMVIVGYDLVKSQLLARNSFGEQWADHGYCWIPFDYATAEFFDVWTFDIDLIN